MESFRFDAGDLTTQFTYNNVNSKLTVKDPENHVTEMTYDDLQRLSTTKDALNKVTQFEYGTNSGSSAFNSSGFKPTQATDPRQYRTIVEYDALGRATKKKVEYQTGVFSETRSEYDDVGNVIHSYDPLNHLTKTDYDGLNRPTLVTYADNTTQQLFYTSTGLKYKTINENSGVTESEFDAAGRPVKVLSPTVNGQRAVTQSIYDAAGNAIETINPRGFHWHAGYDARNRKIYDYAPTDENGIQSGTWTEYDLAGNVFGVTDSMGYRTEKHYDPANRLVEVVMPSVQKVDGTWAQPVVQTTYDKVGNVLTVKDANNHVTTNVYDEVNRLFTTTDAEGIVVTNTYDEVGNKLTVKDGKNQTTTFTYDGLNRNLTTVDPLGRTVTFAYDGMNKTARLDSLGHETQYEYDLRNRLEEVHYLDRLQDDRIYGYDLVGNLLSVTEPGKAGKADVGYTYDELNRIKTETSGGVTHVYEYDLAGNRTKTTYGNTNRVIDSTYDALNRLLTMTEPSGTTRYTYDFNSNIRQLTLPNGDKTINTLDALNRTIVSESKNGGNYLISRYTNAYDLVGNVGRITEEYGAGGAGNRVVTNSYDDNNRLLTEVVTGQGAITTTYTYDDANNRSTMTKGSVTTNYAYNTLNQLTGYSDGSQSITLTYDFNGNRSTKSGGGSSTTYTYDNENRLIQSVKDGGTLTFTYDYLLPLSLTL